MNNKTQKRAKNISLYSPSYFSPSISYVLLLHENSLVEIDIINIEKKVYGLTGAESHREAWPAVLPSTNITIALIPLLFDSGSRLLYLSLPSIKIEASMVRDRKEK